MSDALVYLGREPLNAEVRLERVTGRLTRAGQHYVRDHFAVPEGPEAVEVDGLVEAPTRLTVVEIRAMPARTLVATMECAGNGRAYTEPATPGEQWHLGAVGTAEWTGVPLREVLDRARPRGGAVEVLFTGADRGTPAGLGSDIAYERSLPFDDAMADGPLLAYAMNGSPLPREHGAPLRLVVPGWYGMASVKWLRRIRLIDRAFDGFYQADRYVIDGRPLRTMAPRAVVTTPAEGARLPRAPFVVAGRVWTGRSSIESVEVSSDGGYSWHRATLAGAEAPYAWREWSTTVDPGDRTAVTIVVFAATAEGEQQPIRPVWNALGYANNAARPLSLRIG